MFLIDVQRDQVEGVRALLLQRLNRATEPVRAGAGAAGARHRRTRPAK